MTKPLDAALERKTFEIENDHDRFWCAAEGRRFAQAMGFDTKSQGEIAICIAELASNVAKFAGRGTLTLEVLDTPGWGLRIIAEDMGPGLPDAEVALEDGFSEGRRRDPGMPRRTGQGLGVGLGAVVRMMSQVEVESAPNQGFRVVAVKWLEPPSRRG